LVELVSAQIKVLSYLAFVIKPFADIVTVHSTQLVEGMIGMLESCPMEVTHLRKELLIASRHILNTDLRISIYKLIFSLFIFILMFTFFRIYSIYG